MTTLRIERTGDDLIIRLPPEAQAALGVREGDTVTVVKGDGGEVVLAPTDIDHRMRADRGRAFLRRLRG
jgi:antitoxin component of MazEF toxin-antitoxin module